MVIKLVIQFVIATVHVYEVANGLCTWCMLAWPMRCTMLILRTRMTAWIIGMRITASKFDE